jgi:diguanylate cyclase (GGDEF)-like protein
MSNYAKARGGITGGVRTQVNVATKTGWAALPTWLRSGIVLSVYFIASFLFVVATNRVGADVLIALIYPGAGLHFVLLFVFGLRYWPAVFLNPYVGSVFNELFGQPHLPFASLALFAYSLIQVIGFTGGAWLLQRLHFDARLPRVKDTVLLLSLGSFVATLFVSVLTIALFTWLELPLLSDNFILNTLNFWAGDATGVAMTAPLLFVLFRSWLKGSKALTVVKRPLTRLVVLERIAQFTLLAATVYLGYARESVGLLNYSYAIFMPLMWIGVRSGFVVAAWSVFILNMLVTLAVNFNLTDPEVVALQFNLMVASYAVLLLGAVSSDLFYKREKLGYVAYHDALTGLLNRAGFLRHLENRKGKSLAVFLLDIDRFKMINDSFGQTVGDAFLLLVSRRLKGVLPPGALLARLGGDEFAVCLENINEAEATALAAAMNETLAVSNRIQGYDIATDASIGIAFSLEDYDAGNLLRDAESAMQEAKRQGKARYILFDTALQQQLKEKVRLERDLRQALERQEISVHYQPIVSLATGEIAGAEALMRWRHGQLGNISPAAFIPIAEDTGLIVDLSNALLAQVLGDAKQFPSSFYISANLSVRQLQHPGLEATIQELLQRTATRAQRLVLEVTESSLMTNPDANIATLEGLSNLGIRLAMDDFGTGYASLNYLKRLPVDILKIDRSFVKGLPDDDDDATLVTTIMALAQSLKLSIVAEGVETKNQEAFLKQYGCQQVQGYLYSKPVPLAEFLELLGNGRKVQG